LQIEENEIDRRVARFKETARSSGIKLTHQRLEIFRQVASSVDHPSAEAVLKALRPRMPTLSLDTVYRTLWLLSDLGLVSTLGPRRDVVRFDPNTTPHHHYVCARCGMTRDFESEELNGLRIPTSVETFGSVDAMRVEVVGVCSRCAKEQNEASRDSNSRGAGHDGGSET